MEDIPPRSDEHLPYRNIIPNGTGKDEDKRPKPVERPVYLSKNFEGCLVPVIGTGLSLLGLYLAIIALLDKE